MPVAYFQATMPRCAQLLKVRDNGIMSRCQHTHAIVITVLPALQAAFARPVCKESTQKLRNALAKVFDITRDSFEITGKGGWRVSTLIRYSEIQYSKWNFARNIYFELTEEYCSDALHACLPLRSHGRLEMHSDRI